MPELGKATYYLVIDSAQYDSGLDRAEAEATAAGGRIDTALNRAGAAADKLAASTGRAATRFAAGVSEMGASATGAGERINESLGAATATANRAGETISRSGLRVARGWEEGAAGVRASAGEIEAASAKMATATTEAGAKIRASNSATESSYVKLSASGTKAYERIRLGPLAAIAVTAYEGIKTLNANTAAQAQLDNTMRNLGVNAGITSHELHGLTDELEMNSNFTRADITGAEQLAVGFQDVTDKARFVKLALDAASYSHKSLRMITLALGRAFENPAQGLTKLGRAGLAFNASQIAMAKQITLTSGVAAGQAYVFQLLEGRVKGAAKAAADAQPWVRLWNQFKEIAASIMSGLLPAFRVLVGGIASHRRAVTILVGALLALSAAYVTIKVAMMAWVTVTKLALLAQKLYAASTILLSGDVKGAVLALRAKTGAELADTVAAQRAAAANVELGTAEGAAGAGAVGLGEKIRALAVAGGPFAILIAIGAAAILTLMHFRDEAKKAQDTADEAINRTGTKQQAALAYYAERVKFLISQGMSQAAARVQADADTFAHLGIHIGQQTAQGMSQGISDSAQTVTTAATAAGTQAGDAMGKSTADALKQQLATLQQKAAASVQKVYQQMLAQIQSARGKVSDAWGDFTGRILEAYDARTQTMLDGIGTRTENMVSKMNAQFQKLVDQLDQQTQRAVDALNAQFQAASDRLTQEGQALTPAEAQLKQLQAQHEADQLAQQLHDAQTALAKAQATGDPRAIFAAQQQLADAQYAIKVAELQREADLERKARDTQIAQEQSALEKSHQSALAAMEKQHQSALATLEKQRSAVEKQIRAQAAIQAREFASARALYREHLVRWFNMLLPWLEKHPAQWRQVYNNVLRVLGSDFGPRFVKVARSLGTSFVTGLHESANRAADAALVLEETTVRISNRFGSNLAHGIVNGLGNLEPMLYYTIYKQVYNALMKLRAAFKISSPSQYTAETVGAPLASGIIVGFERVLPQLAESMTRTVQLAISRAQSTIEGAVGGGGGGDASNNWGYPKGVIVDPIGTIDRMNPPTSSSPTSPHNWSGGQIDSIGPPATVNVNQYISSPEPDPHQLLLEANFAAQAVFA